jgi:hypothetical protein
MHRLNMAGYARLGKKRLEFDRWLSRSGLTVLDPVCMVSLGRLAAFRGLLRDEAGRYIIDRKCSLAHTWHLRWLREAPPL